jgi:prepilin-type N-terminal cleavage/methylation domain-containing protein
MSSRPRPDVRPRGFTLLECLIAILVLSLLAAGLARLTVDHTRLVASLDAWAASDPTYYVAQPQDAMERLVGVPAALATDPPLPPAPAGAGPLEVSVAGLQLQLDPPEAEALAHLEDA